VPVTLISSPAAWARADRPPVAVLVGARYRGLDVFRAALRETPAEGDSQRPSRTTFAAGASQADHDSGGK